MRTLSAEQTQDRSNVKQDHESITRRHLSFARIMQCCPYFTQPPGRQPEQRQPRPLIRFFL